MKSVLKGLNLIVVFPFFNSLFTRKLSDNNDNMNFAKPKLKFVLKLKFVEIKN